MLLLFIALSFNSCIKKPHPDETRKYSHHQVTEKLLNANKAAIEFENDQIDKLILSSGWKMQKTATGLRYQIIEVGKGERVSTGKVVRFEYEVKLFSGEIIYSSKSSGLKEFRVGSGGVETGLEEGILLLRVGDKVRFIIPSYLAHGLSGDQDKVPPRASLIYTLKLIEFK
jgi:FKBP-type peptidyl-prolyl cis-trans isomerase